MEEVGDPFRHTAPRRSFASCRRAKSVVPLSLQDVVAQNTTEILPHLLISTTGDAILDDTKKLLRSGIVFLINCCEHASLGIRTRSHLSVKKGFTVLHLNLRDESDVDLTGAFQLALPLIKKAKREKKKCLIHCHSGMSRSVSLVLAYLMAHERMTLIDAVAHVKQCRKVASPNPGFMAQLINLERAVDRKKGGDGSRVPTVDIDLYRSDRFGEPEAFSSDGTGRPTRPSQKRHIREMSETSLLLPLLESSSIAGEGSNETTPSKKMRSSEMDTSYPTNFSPTSSVLCSDAVNAPMLSELFCAAEEFLSPDTLADCGDEPTTPMNVESDNSLDEERDVTDVPSLPGSGEHEARKREARQPPTAPRELPPSGRSRQGSSRVAPLSSMRGKSLLRMVSDSDDDTPLGTDH